MGYDPGRCVSILLNVEITEKGNPGSAGAKTFG